MECLLYVSLIFSWVQVPGFPYTYEDTINSADLLRTFPNKEWTSAVAPDEEYTRTKVRSVTGSVLTAPPWSANYASLTTPPHTHQVSTLTGGTVPARTVRKWYMLWINEVGKETFMDSGSDPLVTASRFRDWWTYNGTVTTDSEYIEDSGGPG